MPGLAFRQPAHHGGELLAQFLPLAFQRPQSANVRTVRRTGQMREHVNLAERSHHQGRRGSRMRHERPVGSGHVSLPQGTTPKVADLRLGFRAAKTLDRISVLPVQDLLNELRYPSRLRRKLHEVTVNPVLALVGLELDSRLGGNPAELGEAETRAADRTVVSVPDLPEQASARRRNCDRRPGAPRLSELGALHRQGPIEAQLGPACGDRSDATVLSVLDAIVHLVRKKRVRSTRTLFVEMSWAVFLPRHAGNRE